MSEATVQGVVHLVEETKTYGQKGFRKRLVVLEQENGRFTNFIPVEFVQDNCDSADGSVSYTHLTLPTICSV